MTKHIESLFGLRVFSIISYDKGLIEKNLFTFKRSNIMFSPILFNIVLVPFETDTFL